MSIWLRGWELAVYIPGAESTNFPPKKSSTPDLLTKSYPYIVGLVFFLTPLSSYPPPSTHPIHQIPSLTTLGSNSSGVRRCMRSLGTLGRPYCQEATPKPRLKQRKFIHKRRLKRCVVLVVWLVGLGIDDFCWGGVGFLWRKLAFHQCEPQVSQSFANLKGPQNYGTFGIQNATKITKSGRKSENQKIGYCLWNTHWLEKKFRKGKQK